MVVILGGLGLMVLRRKIRGKPAFSIQDWQLFFGRLNRTASAPKRIFNFATAVVLASFSMFVAFAVFASLGPALVTVALLITILGIINKVLS